MQMYYILLHRLMDKTILDHLSWFVFVEDHQYEYEYHTQRERDSRRYSICLWYIFNHEGHNPTGFLTLQKSEVYALYKNDLAKRLTKLPMFLEYENP